MKNNIKKIISTIMVLMILLSANNIAFASASIIPLTEENTSLRCFDIDTQEETIINLFDETLKDGATNVASAYVQDNGQRNSSGSQIGSLRSIIGTDDRVQVTNTTSHPYYPIVYIRAEFNNGTWKPGTGFMISKNVLLTAGHCVYTAGTTVKSITVYPGRNGNSYTISSTSKKVYTDTKYTGSETDWDYGIVTLNDNLGDTSGWLGLHATSSASSLDNKSITTAGYPSDKATNDNRTMWRSAGVISNVSTYRFGHNADTESGQSGSPVYFYNSTYGYQAAGIHTHAGNSARRITNSLFDWLAAEGYINP